MPLLLQKILRHQEEDIKRILEGKANHKWTSLREEPLSILLEKLWEDQKRLSLQGINGYKYLSLSIWRRLLTFFRALVLTHFYHKSTTIDKLLGRSRY